MIAVLTVLVQDGWVQHDDRSPARTANRLEQGGKLLLALRLRQSFVFEDFELDDGAAQDEVGPALAPAVCIGVRTRSACSDDYLFDVRLGDWPDSERRQTPVVLVLRLLVRIWIRHGCIVSGWGLELDQP